MATGKSKKSLKVEQDKLKAAVDAGLPAEQPFPELEYIRLQLDYEKLNEEARQIVDVVMYGIGVGSIDPNTLLSIFANLIVFSTVLMRKDKEGNLPTTEERAEVLGRVAGAFNNLLDLHEGEFEKFKAFKAGQKSQIIVPNQDIVVAAADNIH